MFLDYTSRRWASEFDKITSPQGRATGPRKTEVVRNFTSVCSLYYGFRTFITLNEFRQKFSVCDKRRVRIC